LLSEWNNMEQRTDLAVSLQEWASIFARRSIHEFMRFAQEHGLTMAQISVLLQLYHRGPGTILAVRGGLHLSRAAVSQLVDRLVQMGFVERAESPEDRRVKLISLTPAGTTLVAEGIARRRGWLGQVAGQFTPDRQVALASALRVLSEAALKLEARGEEEN
jgi:DNA-binding MarR family transcriptional regulator